MSICDFVVDIREWPDMRREDGLPLYIADRLPDMSTITVNPAEYELIDAKYKDMPMYFKIPRMRE